MVKYGATCMVVMLLLTTLFSQNLEQQKKSKEKIYSVEKKKKVKFVIPQGWKDKVEKKSGFSPYTVSLVDPKDKSSKLLVSMIPLDEQPADFKNQENIRKSLEIKGEQLLSSSVQDSLVIVEFSGINSPGYYYFLTDRAPKPGEYKHIYQGSIGVGEILVTFTLLTNNKDSEFIDQAFDLIIKIEFIKPG
ncbi:MAG: hypothetical protein JXL67_09800 [Calditrichaeota bacterium]|nr:hypothetical protein [Calditrichota bacterium]